MTAAQLPETEAPSAAFGCMLAEAMDSLGVSNRWVAEKCGVSESAVSRWRSGSDRPDATKLAILVKLLRLDLETASAAAGRDPAVVERVAELVRMPDDFDPLFDFLDRRLHAIKNAMNEGRRGDAETEFEDLLVLLDESAKDRPDRAEFWRRRAEVTHHLLTSLRETHLPETAPARERDRAPRTLLARTRPLLGDLHDLALLCDDPSIEGLAFLDEGHAYYIAGKSTTALDAFQQAEAYPTRNDDLLLNIRTQALAAAYRIAQKRHAPVSDAAPDWVREDRRLIVRCTRRVRRRVEAGLYDSPHSAMTALEGVARACGIIGRDKWFVDAMAEAEGIHRGLVVGGIYYPLPVAQRLYAKLKVCQVRGEEDEFHRLLRDAGSSIDPAVYPRHWQQIEDLMLGWLIPTEDED